MEDSAGDSNWCSVSSSQEDSQESKSDGAMKDLRAASASSSVDSIHHTDSSLGNKNESQESCVHVENNTRSQIDAVSKGKGSHSSKDDKWQQLVNDIRSMSLRKMKASDANAFSSVKTDEFADIDVPSLSFMKTDQSAEQSDFSDLDLPRQKFPTENQELVSVDVANKKTKQGLAKHKAPKKQDRKGLKSSVSSFDELLDKQSLTETDEDYNTDDLVEDLEQSKPLDQSKLNSKHLPHGLVHGKAKHKSEQPVASKSVDNLFSFGGDTSKAGGASQSLSTSKFKDINSEQDRNQTKIKNLSFDSKDSSYTRASQISFAKDSKSSSLRLDAQKDVSHSKLSLGKDGGSAPARNSIFYNKREAADQFPSNSDGTAKPKYMVCVPSLPCSSNPGLIKSAMAVYGEVTGFFKKHVAGERLNVYVQFKTAEGMERALAVGRMQLGHRTCSIVKADHSVFSSVVRVFRVGYDIDESQFRSICEAYGKVDYIKKRGLGIYDVAYGMKELGNMSNILASLNEVELNRRTLAAISAPVLHPSVQKEALKTPEGKVWHELQSNVIIGKIEAGLSAVSVAFEDLKELTAVEREYLNNN
ncbi:hypothetical protein KP509_02G078400 [Ceratopteris richardii]|nr:hypothetical protein KP509_02G078400 [Ceratopteris richardii]